MDTFSLFSDIAGWFSVSARYLDLISTLLCVYIRSPTSLHSFLGGIRARAGQPHAYQADMMTVVTAMSRTGRSTFPIALYPCLADLELAGFPALGLPLPRLNHPA